MYRMPAPTPMGAWAVKLFKPEDCDKCTYFENKVGGYTQVTPGEPCISLTRANEIFEKWLAKGTVVTGSIGYHWMGVTKVTGALGEVPGANDTHRAILVCVEPIEKDSIGALLKDLSETARPDDWIKELSRRAKRLLGKAGGE